MCDGLSELTGGNEATFVVLNDPKVGQHTHEERAQLRSLPLLKELGFSRFLHRPLWDNGFRMVEYEFIPTEELYERDELFPLVHVVSQKGLKETEVRRHEIPYSGEQHIVKDLLRKRSEDDIYILVTDSTAPKAPAISPSRPITDEYGPVTTVRYPDFVDEYVKTQLDSAIPMTTTRNYFFHQISDHHRSHGLEGDTLLSLFDYDRIPPDSPAWEPLYFFVEHDLDQVLERYTERIRETLRSWLERGDVTDIANKMDEMLTRCGFRADRLDEQRQMNAEQYDNV